MAKNGKVRRLYLVMIYLNQNKLKLAINSLEVISEDEKLRFKSSLNYLIFEEKVSIPFWFGDRTFN